MKVLVRIAFAAAVPAITACSGYQVDTDPLGPDVSLLRLRAEPYAYTNYSGLAEPDRILVRDAATWEALWRQIHAGRTPLPPVPSVDFAREMVVVAALGTRSSGGYNILLERASLDGAGGIVVTVRSTSPGNNCVVTAVLTAPVDIASMPAHAGPVHFVQHSEVRNCT